MEQSLEVLLRGNQFKLLVENRITEIRKKYQLKKIDIEILNFLSKSGERNTSKDIQQLLLINKGYISQSVDRLRNEGYLQFVQDDKDRRFVHFLLLEKSEPIVKDINLVWEEMISKVFYGITEDEITVMNSVSKKIDANMNCILKNLEQK